MADSTSLSILRQTPLSSSIATKKWTEENFAHSSDLYTLSGEVVEGLSNVVIPKLDTISGLVEDEVEKVDEISAKLSSYSLTGHTHTSSDITNFPPIPTVSNGTLTIQKNGTAIASFSANQSTNVSANITVPTKTSELTNDSGFLTAHQSLSDYTLTSDFKDLISTVTDELSNNINPKLSTIADQVSAETQKVDEISARLDDFALTSDIPSDYLSGVKMNGSLRTVTNKVADLGTVISSHQQLSIQDEYTEWVVTPSYIMSVDEYSQDYLGKTIYLKWVEWEPGNPNASGWQPYVLAGSTIDWCGGFIGNLSSTELVWEELNWIGEGSLSAKRYKKSAVLGDQTSVDLALADHTHSLSDIANVPGVMQTGSYNDLLDKPTIPLSTSQLTNNSGFLTAHQSLSAYALSSDLFSLSSQVVNGLSNTVTLKLSTIADLISSETKKLDELSGSLSEYALTSQIPTKVSELSNDSGYVKKTELQSDLSNYLPLSGGMISGNFALSAADEYGHGPYNFLSGITRNLAFGLGSSATGAGANALGTGAVAKGHESFAVGRNAQIQNEYNVDCVAIGYNAAVNAGSSYADGDHAIQLGYGMNTTPHTFQVFDYTLMNTATGDIPYARLSSCGFRTILPIVSNNNLTVTLSSDVKTYRITDSSGNGTFPILSAPTNISDFGDCYYAFEIEWMTNSTAASFPQQHDWINYPEMQSDGQQHTYYITGRYDSTNTEYTMNCWRVK